MTKPEGFPRDEFEGRLEDMENTLEKAEYFFQNDKEMRQVINDTRVNVYWIFERSRQYSSEYKTNLNNCLRQKRQQ